MKRYKEGHILFITIAILALLSIMSITFISTSSVEKNVSSIAIQNCNAKLAAEAGLEYGISQLRKDFGGSIPITALGTGNWWYHKSNSNITTNNSEQTPEELLDNAAVEVRLDSLHRKQDPTTKNKQVLAIPSYCVSNEEQENEEEEAESGENESAIITSDTQFIPKNAPKNISGVCGDTAIKTFTPSVHFPFTLKIVDTTSQFPLNTHVSQNQMNQLMGLTDSNNNTYDNNAIEIVGPMLDCLSAEVAKLSAWKAYKPNDKNGPLHGLGTEIIRERNKKKNSEGKYCGFLSKYDIVGKYTKCENASSDEITIEDLSYIWDYITVQPTWEEMAVQNIYRQIAPINGTEKQYRIEYRCPVNINTASYPVLMAVLQGISITNGISTDKNTTIEQTITPEKADIIASAIIGIRSGKLLKNLNMTQSNNAIPFKTWNAFNYFIDVLNNMCSSNTNTTIQNCFTDETWDMIKANFNPNVHLKKTNPDLTVYQNVTKPELYKYTTEFCFFPLGYFEITSLGEQYDDQGNILYSHHIVTNAHIYNTLYHTSQYDFEGGTSGYQTVLVNKNVQNQREYVAYDPSNMASRINPTYDKANNNADSYGTGYNAFTLGNNIYKSSTDFSTLWKNASKLFGAIAPLGYRSTKTEKYTDQSGNTLYTGSKALDGQDAYVFQEDFSNSNITNAFPDPYSDTGRVDHTSESYLLADGLYLQPGMPADMPVKKYEINENNFPPIDIDNPLNNECTILFWFKINSQWDDSKNDAFHTVFLSNQVEDNIKIQREIKFQVKIPTKDELGSADGSNTKQFLRKLTIEVITRVIGDNLAESNYAYKEVKKNYIFDPYIINANTKPTRGIHAQEWYHLAVRWQDASKNATVDDSNTTATNNNDSDRIERFLVLCGNFYHSNDALTISSTTAHRSYGMFHDERVYKYQPYGKTAYEYSFLKERNTISSEDETELANVPNVDDNVFFIGSYQDTNQPLMTIADFRISKLKNTITDKNYRPTHSPQAKEINSETISNKICHAIYQGRTKLPNNMPTEQKYGSITSYAWTSYGDSSLYAIYTGKNYDTKIDYEKAFNQIFNGGQSTGRKPFDYNHIINKKIRFETWLYQNIYYNNDGTLDKDNKKTYKNSYFTTNPYSSNTDIFWKYPNNTQLTEQENHVLDSIVNNWEYRRLKQRKDEKDPTRYGNPRNYSNYRGKDYQQWNGSIFVSDYTISDYPGEYNVKQSQDENGNKYLSIRYLYDMKFDSIEDLITYYLNTWNKALLGQIKTEESSITPTDTVVDKLKDLDFVFLVTSSNNDCIALETPYVFTNEKDSWVYEIIFPVSTSIYSNENQVFNNAIVDDVTVFYLLYKTDISDRYSIFTKTSK